MECTTGIDWYLESRRKLAFEVFIVKKNDGKMKIGTESIICDELLFKNMSLESLHENKLHFGHVGDF